MYLWPRREKGSSEEECGLAGPSQSNGGVKVGIWKAVTHTNGHYVQSICATFKEVNEIWLGQDAILLQRDMAH